MGNQTYCTQQNGDCQDCSLVNYGRDCKNNPVASNIVDGYCPACNRPVIYCIHTANHHNSMAARINVDIANDPNRIKPDQVAAFFGT